mgnify:CR=1 FL=1
MFRAFRQSFGFKVATYLTGMLQFAFPPYAIAQSAGPQIVLDGRTDTSLNINQNVTDVYTGTVLGNTGFNSFSIFNVYEGNEVNLYLPDGATALMNMVHDQQTVIDGYLNAYKDGAIGGDVFFLNPHGVMVGAQGVMNVGSATLVAPTQDFMNNMFGANGMISAPQVTRVLDNDIPLSSHGLITVRGAVNATGGAALSASDISVTGTVETGRAAVVSIQNLVNMNEGGLGGAVIDLSSVEAGISLVADDDVDIAGRLGADGAEGIDAGTIDVRAGDDITLSAGADLSADGQGLNSDGGTVITFADDAALLGRGARLSADGGTSGDGGFVEFSAIRLVELAGGQLSAAAQDGTDGAVLIDPDDIIISADLLRDASANGGTGDADNNTSWNAGALTLQASNSIVISDNITISSRRVTSASSASAHRNDSSVADSGAIILQSDNITLGQGALITSKATGSFDAGNITLDGRIVIANDGAEIDASNSGSGDAGAVLIDVDDRDNASITLDGAVIRGGNITLDADARFDPAGVYDNPTAVANAEIILENSAELIASDNISLTADAFQNKHAYSGGVLVQFDARTAASAIDLRGATLTASDDVTIASASTIQTDMSPTGWSSLASLLPLNVSVAVTYSTSDVLIDGASNITASGDLSVNAEAITQSTILSQSNSAGAALVAAVSATENRATVNVADNASLSGSDGVSLKTKGKTQVTAIADASAGSIANLSGAIAIGVGIVRDNTSTIISDDASITSSAGDIEVLADSQSQTVFAARAANDDNFTATVQEKFDAGIDDTAALNQSFLGFNLASFLKSEVADQITTVTSQMDATNDGSGGIQLSGALTFSDVQNDTETFVKGSGSNAPSLSAANGAIDIKARAVTQAQGFASGRTDNGSVGGSAGIAIQLIENTLISQVQGTDNANVNLTSDNLTVAALTQAYEDNVSDLNKYNIFVSSGVGNDGDNDEVGIAGAIAVQVSNVNDVTAEIGDNVTATIDDNVVVTASNNTEVKVKADGSKGAQAASDEFFAVLDNATPSEQVVKTNSVSGKLGIGASLAFAITENDVIARVDGGALFSGTDNLSVTADQISTTESEARSSGSGGVALVPVAAISVARNNALALIDSGASTLTLADKATIASTQNVKTSSVGNGAADTGGDASLQVAVGLSAGISVSFDNNSARLSRDLSVPGGLEIAALTSHDVQSGAQSSAQKIDPELIENADAEEEDADAENTADNATNNSTTDTVDGLLGTTNGQSGKAVNADAIKNKLNTNFANVSGGDTPVGGPESTGSNEGKSVAIAGAFGVTYAESDAVAEISSGVTVNGGSDNISVSSLKNTDMTSTGDASTGGSDVNVGGGVGLNIAKSNNAARIGDEAVITASDLSVVAGMRSQLAADNSTDATNVITASATAGSGTGEVAIAGSIALNVVLENNATARIGDNVSLTLADGDVVVEAVATNNYDASSTATVGKTNALFAGIDAALSGLQDITVWTSSVAKTFTNLTSSAVNQAYSEGELFADPSEGGGDDDSDSGDDEGGFGLGAGISINAVIEEKTKAVIEDNVTFDGTGRSDSLRVAATATTTTSTKAFAGAKPGAGNDPDAKTSLDAAVAVSVVIKDVDARLGSASTILTDGDVDVVSTANTVSQSTAKGEVSASSTAVGASVAVGVVLETNEAVLNSNLNLANNGALSVQADSNATDIVLADATAAGAALDKYSNKLGMEKSDLLGSTRASSSDGDTPASMSALNGDFTGGQGADFDTTGDKTSTPNGEGGESKQSGSINIAASVAANWADHSAKAFISDNLSITSAGDVLVEATNDANYRTRGSGMSVFADKSIGVGVGLLKTGQVTEAEIGENVGINAGTSDVNVRAISSENQGTDPDNASINFGGYASAEGIAGAGGGELGVAGSLALTFSYDRQLARIRKNSTISSAANVGVTSTATNKIVTRAWAMALASDATCDDPGNCGSSSGDKTAVGASIAVNIVIDNNTAEIGENVDISAATDNVSVIAKDLKPSNAEFLLDPSDNTTNTEDYIQANYTATLQNSSYYAEAIAGGAAQNGNAGSGSLAVTVSVGKTQALVGEGVQIGGDNFTVEAFNSSDARHLVGAVALADKKAIGASISGIYLREDVNAYVAYDSDSVATDNVTVDITGDMSVGATADQNALTIMAAGGVSSNELALAGAFGFNVLDSDVEARIRRNADITSSGGSVAVNATSLSDIQNFAIAVAGSGGSDSAGGSLALNLFLTDKKAIVGDNAASDNNIQISAANDIDVSVDTKQEIMNGVISAAVSTSSNAISGALSSNIVKGDSYALVQQGADLNTDSTVTSSTQAVSVTAVDNTTITDLTGTLAASSSTSIGVALGANVFWKDVQAGINSTVNADDNVIVSADTEQNLTATVVGIAGSSGGLAGAGSVSVGLVKSTTEATIGSAGVIDTDGSVSVHAGDDTDIFMLEPAASFSSGGTALAGAVGAAVFIGTTKARILDNAEVTANGNEAMQVEIDSTYTTSPLLDGIFGGGDNETRDALGDFNDNFTFDNIKDLFLTETRNTETRRGVSVSAVSDQDVISIAASGAVSSDSAIAISLSAGVGVHTTEASIGDGVVINDDISSANAAQDVVVRAISDTYWVDLSAALGVGTGSAGVGIGADVVVQVKNTDAFISQNAVVKANQNVAVEAAARDKIINSAATIGVGSTAGVAGTASVAVIINDTQARIDGDVRAEDNVSVDADGTSELIQIAGAVGGGGTAGIGASFGIAVVKGETRAIIGNTAQVDGKGTTSVTADSTENSVAAVLAGGIGGTVGVSVAAGIKVHDSTTKAQILGGVNQRFDDASYSAQDVAVRATNAVTTIDVIGGIGGGGTVGVGVSLNALVVHNKAQASIEGAVRAERDIAVEATSAKSTKNFTLAGAAGGTVSVAGNVAVLMVGAQADEETDKQMTGSGDSNLADDADSRNNSLIVSDIISDNASDGDYSRTGTGFSEVASTIDSKQADTNIGTKFNNYDNTTSLNQTKAFITSSATVEAGRDLTVEAEDTTETIFTAGAIGGAGIVGVGVTVGVVLVNNTAQAYIGDGASVNATRRTLVRARTSEDVNSGALSAGGAGITSVQGVVMAQVTNSTTHAFIGDNASVNQQDNSSTTQEVAVLAESDTSLLSVSGSGGGALVGVGITGDAVVLDKETKAYIGDNARVSSGGDITVDADAETDIIQVALSINGGLVGVTGSAGVVVAKNETAALIGSDAVIYATDSVRLEARDDTEIDAVVIAGSGGAVGVSGAFGTYIFKSQTQAAVDDGASITALADGDGLDAANGVIDNSSTSITSKQTRDQDGNEKTDNFTVVDAQFGTDTNKGLSIAAVTNEDMNFAPVGLGFGAVGVAGVVATTVANSITRAKVGDNVIINNDLTGASADQDVRLLAKSNTQLNNISSGISAGGVAVSLDIDTQVFTKTVEAVVGDNVTMKATQNIAVEADSTDRIYQTMISVAAGANAVGGIVGVSVIGDNVRAEIGDDATLRAGDNLTVQSDQEMHLVQSAGNIAVGFGGAGIGTSLGVLVAKSSNTAKIGDNADIAVRDALLVTANTDTNLNQNIIGFSGDPSLAISGALGINILKTSTVAEIGDGASINQVASYNDVSTQSISVIANDNVTTQAAGGAAAFAGGAGAGIGAVATVTRNTVAARIGTDLVASAQGDVRIRADSTKDVSNQGIAAAGGLGLGAAGSLALTLIGGEMSDNASQNLSNDNGDMVSEAAADAGEDRGNYDNDSAKTNTAAYTEADDNETLSLVAAQTGGIDDDINGDGADSTLAEIGANAQITANGALAVEAEETLKLSQISGGAAVGAVGVGGFIAVADYAGSVQARIGANAVIDNITDLTVSAVLDSGANKTISLPDGSTISVAGVNSTVIGASVGLVGLTASIAQVNLTENATAQIGDNVTINAGADNGSVSITSTRDVDAEVNVAAVAAGIAAAGVSYAAINAGGNSRALIGNDVRFGSSTNRFGATTIRARNTSTQKARAVSAGLGYYGAVVGAVVKLDDSGDTKAVLGNNVVINSNGLLTIASDDRARNDSEAVGVAVSGGVGLSIISSKVDVDRDAYTEIGDNVTLRGNGLAISSSIGELGQNMAESDVTGAGGGLLAGVTGSESIITNDADTKITIGQNSQLYASQASGGEEVSAADSSLSATNYANASNDSNAIAIGAVAIGAHVTRTTQTGGALIQTGNGGAVDVLGNISYEALSDRDTRSVSIAGAGGLGAVTAGEGAISHSSDAQIIFDNGTGSGNGIALDVTDNLTLTARNQDSYDGSLDAGAVAVAGATGAKLRNDGTANTAIDFGNFATITAHNMTATSENNLAKTGLDENFRFDGGGGISVTVGDSRTTQAQTNRLDIGDNSSVDLTGTGTNQGTLTLNALTDVTASDEMVLNTGALVGVPVSDTAITATASNDVVVGTGSSLTTMRGDIVISAKLVSDVEADAKTSVWGLAGIGATGKSSASLTSSNNIDFAADSTLTGNGALSVTTNGTLDRMDVVAKTNIYNNTLIAGIFDEKADAHLSHDTHIHIREGARLRSATDLTIKASDGVRNASGKGEKTWLQYVGIAVVPLNGKFGNTTGASSKEITLDGTVETGVFATQYLTFGRDFGTFIQDPDNASGVARRSIGKFGSQWLYTDNNTIASLSLDNLTDDAGLSAKSHDHLGFEFEADQSFSNDIDDQIDNLTAAKAATYDSAQTTRLQTRIAALDNQTTFYNAQNDGACQTAQCEINTVQDNITSLTVLIDDNTTTPADRTVYEGQRTQLQGVLATMQADNYTFEPPEDYSIVLADIASEKADLQAQIAALGDQGDPTLATQIDAEIGFLEAMRAQMNTGQVDIIKVNDIYAAAGNVILEADTVQGASTGAITSRNEVSVTIRNDSNSPLKIGEIEIPNAPAGRILFNSQLVENSADINRYNKDKSATLDFGMTSSSAGLVSSVDISSRYDPDVTSYNPSGVDIRAPELILTGEINNRGGSVTVNNLHGSIFNEASINASSISLTSGGAFFVNDKTPGIYNIGAHPESDGGFGQTAASRLDGVGNSTDNDVGGCTGNAVHLDVNNNVSCNEATATQASEDSYSIAGDEVYIMANTINVNGLIQSGIANKTLTINDNHTEFETNDGTSTYGIVIDNITMTGSGANREGVDGVFARYNAGDDVIEVSGLEAKGGEVTLVGKVISTGKGQINVLDGYGTFTINNNSTKKISLAGITNREVEGKVTIIDNSYDDGSDGAMPRITQYTRIGDVIKVVDNNGSSLSKPTVDVSGLNNATGRSSTYDPRDGMRYYYIQGEDVTLNRQYRTYRKKETTGIITWSDTADFRPPSTDFTGVTIPVTELPSADFATREPSVTEDYRFRLRDTTEQTYSNTYEEPGSMSCWDILIYKKCTWYVLTDTTHEGSLYYMQDVRADRQIDIQFIGADQGSITVNSAGSIEVASVDAAGSTMSLTSTAGDILSSASTNSLSVDNITFDASGSVGTSANPFVLVQDNNSSINIDAGNGVYMQTATGNLQIDRLVNTDGNIDLSAGQDLILTTTSNALVGDNISLRAEFGEIRDVSGNALRFDLLDSADNGSVSVYSRVGDIAMVETQGDMRVGVIDIAGNLNLTVDNGSLLDGNAEQIDDTQTQSALLALWTALALTGSEAETKKADQQSSYEDTMTQLYVDYWNLRNVTDDDGTYVADAYDPNFSYVADADEEAMLDNDAARITAYENDQQARYQLGHEKFGSASYSDNFTYAATSTEIAEFSAGYEWDQDYLDAPLPSEAFKETTDTTAFIETANITADNITLTVSTGNIGTFTDVDNFTIQDISDGNLDNASKIKLAAAESDDVEHDETTDIVYLTQREDLDIETIADGSVVTINAPQGYAFLGGESDLNIDTLNAAGEVRLKVNGDILNIRSDNNTVLTATDAVLESAQGQIGASDSVFRMELGAANKLTARAANGIWLEEATDDINVSQIYSPTIINLTSPDQILDAQEDSIMDIKGDNVTLTANGSIGLRPADGDSISVSKGKALDVASVNYDNSSFVVTSATDGAWLYGPLGQSLRMTGATLEGPLDVAVGSNLRATGSFNTGAGNDNVTFRSYESLTLEGVGGIDTNGSLLRMIAGSNLTVMGDVSTGGGEIRTTSADNTTFAADANITTSGGNIFIDADGLLNQNVTFEDGALVNLGTGALRIEASDVVKLTGIVTSSDAACGEGTQGCAVTVLANSINDGGNSRDDIELNGNGDIRLNAHKYANLNKIDYNGTAPLQIEVQGKNQGARIAGSMLGIDAEAGINVSKFLANSGAISAPLTNSLTINEGRLRDDLYLSIGDFDARIGRLLDNSLDANEWLLSSLDDGFFNDGALQSGIRAEDYRCTGAPSFIGDGNAVLDVTFSYDNPTVNCSGVLAFYRLPYVLQVPVQSVEQKLNNMIETMRVTNSVRVNPVESGNLEQAIISTDRQFTLASDGVEPQQRISDDAVNLGMTNPAIAEEFANVFGVRESAAVGVVQVDMDQIIQIGLPFAPDALDTQEALEEEEEETEEPIEEATSDEADIPLANNNLGNNLGNNIGVNDNAPIGPLSLLLN